MRLFLDTSVLLAAAGSATGSSRALFVHAAAQKWILTSSPYALNEVLRNLPKLTPGATTDWLRLRPQLAVVDDVVSLDQPRPVWESAWPAWRAVVRQKRMRFFQFPCIARPRS